MYSDEITEFALTLYFYSPKAYKYVRPIIPLPNPSLNRKWSSSFKCEPGFIKEAFKSLSQEVARSPINKDCCLVIDAMSIRKQTLWNPEKDLYSGFGFFGDEILREISFRGFGVPFSWYTKLLEVSHWVFSDRQGNCPTSS